MAKRKVQLIRGSDRCTIAFDIADNPWTTYNDFLGCLNIVDKEKKTNRIFLDFSEIRGALYPQVAISLAGISDYYRETFGWQFDCTYKPGSFFEKANLLHPIRVRRNEDYLSSGIFDKIIRFQNRKEASFVASEIYRQLMKEVVCEQGVLAGLGWCLSEVMDNVITHSNAPCGYVMIQIHNRKKIISVSVFDLGCGLLNSLRRSSVLDVEDEMAAIDLATQKGVTENVKIGQGNGLYGLKRIIEHNESHFSILTGHCSIAYDYENHTKISKTKTPIISKEASGTRVDFTLKYSSRIDLRKALDGYEAYEDIDKEMDEMRLENGSLLYKISEKADGDYGSRPAGQKLRNELLNLAKASEGKILLDFEGVPMVNSSFADELLGRLAAKVGLLSFNQRFGIVNANGDVKIVLERAISLRIKELFDN